MAEGSLEAAAKTDSGTDAAVGAAAAASSGKVAPRPERRISADSAWLKGVGLRVRSLTSGVDAVAGLLPPKLTAFSSGAEPSASSTSIAPVDGDGGAGGEAESMFAGVDGQAAVRSMDCVV
jgi:hypothetical protein